MSELRAGAATVCPQREKAKQRHATRDDRRGLSLVCLSPGRRSPADYHGKVADIVVRASGKGIEMPTSIAVVCWAGLAFAIAIVAYAANVVFRDIRRFDRAHPRAIAISPNTEVHPSTGRRTRLNEPGSLRWGPLDDHQLQRLLNENSSK